MPWLWQCLPWQRAFSSTRIENRFFKIMKPGPAPVGTGGASSQRSSVLSSSPRGHPGAGPSCLGEARSVSLADPCTPASARASPASDCTPCLGPRGTRDPGGTSPQVGMAACLALAAM